MARRRGGDSSALILIVVVSIVAVLRPLALAIFWIKAEWDARQLREADEAYLHPTAEEMMEMQLGASNADAMRAQTADLFAQGTAEQLENRADGLFDGRSKRGKQLNEAIQYALGEAEGWDARAGAARRQALARAENWIDAHARQTAGRVGLITYAAAVGALLAFSEVNHWIGLSAIASVVGGFCAWLGFLVATHQLAARRAEAA